LKNGFHFNYTRINTKIQGPRAQKIRPFGLLVEVVYRNNRCLLYALHAREATKPLCEEMTSSLKQQRLVHAGTARLLKQVHIIRRLVSVPLPKACAGVLQIRKNMKEHKLL
jgi:hypothetical protein